MLKMPEDRLYNITYLAFLQLLFDLLFKYVQMHSDLIIFCLYGARTMRIPYYFACLR